MSTVVKLAKSKKSNLAKFKKANLTKSKISDLTKSILQRPILPKRNFLL